MDLNLNKIFLVLGILITISGVISEANSQSLSDLLEEQNTDIPPPIAALFKSTRIINGHSSKQLNSGELDYRISHRFGQLNSGAYDLYGLDHSTIHLSMEFSPTDRVMIGFGRSSYQKTVDGYVKIKLAEQKSQGYGSPVSITWVSSMEINGLRWTEPDRDNLFSSRLGFFHQLLMARKMDRITLQMMPGIFHRNLVRTEKDYNDLYTIGIGGRYKLTTRFALTAEYYYVFHSDLPSGGPFYNPLSIGFDIETGGHVFQLIFSNSLGMREGAFLGQTTGSWLDGDIHFGFNISRMFKVY